ncbi:MAG: LysR substrate-binding domain-containing protein [Pseudomonadota bacterium]
MDRLAAMSVFVAAVSTGSLSAASRELRMPLPTVSRKVSELEKFLDAKLLVRGTRKLSLTDVGEAYLGACRRILEELAEAERGATGEYKAPQGELVITAPVTLGRLHVLPIVVALLAAHPRVDLRLVLSDRPLNLVDDHLDLAVRVGELPDSSLVAVRIGQIRSVVCASPGYLAAHGTPKNPAELARRDCVQFAGLGGAEPWLFRAAEAVRVRARLVVSTAEAAVDAAACGVGLARVLSYQAADAVKAGKLNIVLKKFEPPPRPVSLVYVRARRASGKLRAFLDFATQPLRVRIERAVV